MPGLLARIGANTKCNHIALNEKRPAPVSLRRADTEKFVALTGRMRDFAWVTAGWEKPCRLPLPGHAVPRAAVGRSLWRNRRWRWSAARRDASPCTRRYHSAGRFQSGTQKIRKGRVNGESEPSNVWMDVQKIFQGLDEARVAAGVEPGPPRSAAIQHGCGSERVRPLRAN